MSDTYDPNYLPPRDGDGRLLWNPAGPDGDLVDLSTQTGRTIGEIVESENPPPYGWYRGPEGTAIPDDRRLHEPPPVAYQQESTGLPTAVRLILLMSP